MFKIKKTIGQVSHLRLTIGRKKEGGEEGEKEEETKHYVKD